MSKPNVYFTGSIKRVKEIRIGDATYSPDEPFDRKNIVTGDVEDADIFTLGDRRQTMEKKRTDFFVGSCIFCAIKVSSRQ